MTDPGEHPESCEGPDEHEHTGEMLWDPDAPY